jgi:chemotaxis protein MotB
MASKGNAVPVIIKKVKSGGHGGHHGGAWKVAYADFVTAMMAFFLLLWLLNVTTDVQKRGIADYFDPTISSKSQSGAGGVLGGLTIGSPGSQAASSSAPALEIARMAQRQPNEGDDGNNGGTVSTDQQDQDDTPPPPPPKTIDDKTLEKANADREQKRFEEAAAQLREAVKDMPELAKLADNLIIENTPEGLRIQLVDQDKQPMYPLGSADMLDPAKKLIALVSQAVMKLPNKVAITGHTDSSTYPAGGKYTNWELSTDRANAARREFITDGVPEDRVARVTGMADQEPLFPKEPASPQNRRISIVLLRQNQEPPAETTAQAAGK